MTFHYNNFDNTSTSSNDFNSKIMLSAIFSLSFVIIVVILLYLYARCALRLPPRQPGAPSSTFIFGHRVQHVIETVPTKTGLDQLVINSLIPLFVFKQLDGQDTNECAVCLSMLESDDVARQLPNCNHIFHVECIDTWLTGQPTCPVCRSDVTPRLALLDREPPRGDGHVEIAVDITNSDHHEQNQQGVISKVNGNNASGPSSSSSFRLSSFKKIIGRERSFNSRRVQVSEEIDLERQGH